MADLRETKIANDACPLCGHHLDRVTAGPDNPDATPQPGDFTVCIQCGGLLVFEPDLKVRPPTEAEATEAMRYPEVIRVIEAIDKVHGRAHGDDA